MSAPLKAAQPRQIAAGAPVAPVVVSNKGKEEAVVAKSSYPSAQSAYPPAQVAVPKSPESVAVARVAPASSAVIDDKEAVQADAGEKWVAEFTAASDKHKKELRNVVTAATKEILAAGVYTVVPGGTPVELDLAGAGSGRAVYTGDETFEKPASVFNTTAHFVKSDAIDTALFLIEKKGVNPLLVVPADPKNPGDGFPGSGSLEEQAYRRTTLWAAIDGTGKTGDFQYSIPEKGAIYLPSVQVFRDSESKNGYQFLKAPRKLALLLASSVAKPTYEHKGKNIVLNTDAKSLLTAKFRTIFNVAIAKGHDAIVLTAFGCGYNGTPPQAVAAIVRDLITTGERERERERMSHFLTRVCRICPGL